MEWFTDFWMWLQDQFVSVLDALNPVRIVADAAMWVVEMLPAQSQEVQLAFLSLEIGMLYMVHYIQSLDYFINLGALIVALGFMATTETVLLVVRTWRFIKSFVI